MCTMGEVRERKKANHLKAAMALTFSHLWLCVLLSLVVVGGIIK